MDIALESPTGVTTSFRIYLDDTVHPSLRVAWIESPSVRISLGASALRALQLALPEALQCLEGKEPDATSTVAVTDPE